MEFTQIYLLVGFLFAAYSVVANDSIQTLGTFLSSNSGIRWYWLFIPAAVIMWVVLLGGWFLNGGDLSFGRLASIPFPQNITFLYALAPAVLLLLTRYGIPVSTTFLVLSVFADKAGIEAMVFKSALGYGVAALAAMVIWFGLSYILNENHRTDGKTLRFWRTAQWFSTGFLWSQWLTHDMANIMVFLPRVLTFEWAIIALSVITFFLGVVFFTHGGKIQNIVLSKKNVRFVRSATIIDFIFGIILFIFKEISNVPMSTTWVFVGLLAGREIAIRRLDRKRNGYQRKVVFPMLAKDFSKIVFGLAISVGLALLVGYYTG